MLAWQKKGGKQFGVDAEIYFRKYSKESQAFGCGSSQEFKYI